MIGNDYCDAGAMGVRRRIVVVGSGGRLGAWLAREFSRRHEVVGFGRRDMDLGCTAAIEAALGRLDYDLLVLTGAMTAVDACESRAAEAMAVNAAGPARIARISRDKGAHVTYISTDMVFDGRKEDPYTESDDPAPVSIYGHSKLAGEQRVLDVSADNLVLRVSWLFGPGRPAFPEWVIQQACQHPQLSLPGDKTACPTYSVDVAQWLDRLLLGGTRPAAGVYHVCNAGVCTWRDWGQYCVDWAKAAGMPVRVGRIRGVPVASVPAFVARRPVHSGLSTAKFEARTGLKPRPWMEAVAEHLGGPHAFAPVTAAAAPLPVETT